MFFKYPKVVGYLAVNFFAAMNNLFNIIINNLFKFTVNMQSMLLRITYLTTKFRIV